MRINGYNIIAEAPHFSPSGKPEKRVKVILGYDATRRYGKYVTALIGLEEDGSYPREWFWGHYFDSDLKPAMEDFIQRIGLDVIVHKTNVEVVINNG